MVTLNAISTIAFLVHVSSVVTIDLGAPIVGCSAVCPQSETNSSLPDCHVPDYGNSSMIGVAELNFSISSDFTWTQAVSITPNVTCVDPSLPPGNLYSRNGTVPSANVLQRSEAHLTCLKPIDEACAIDAFTAMAGDTASGGSKMG